MAEKVLLKIIYLKDNQGHGEARRVSLKNCSNELVALMDSDDISLPHRFMLQLTRFAKDDSLSIVGGQIREFSNSMSSIIGDRLVPEQHEDIIRYSKRRCPMNQVTVMFKKSDVERVGGYIDWYCEEDYYLWLRMIEQGLRFENVPEVLVNVRAGEEMSSRRGGWRYFRSEVKLQSYMLSKKMISIVRYLFNVSIRFFGEVILSNKLRAKVFKLIRSKGTTNIDLKGNLNELQVVRDGSGSHPPFSVALCVYGKDNPEWFDKALESVIIHQTIRPSEVVVVVDGPVPNGIHSIIRKYSEICAKGITTEEEI